MRDELVVGQTAGIFEDFGAGFSGGGGGCGLELFGGGETHLAGDVIGQKGRGDVAEGEVPLVLDDVAGGAGVEVAGAYHCAVGFREDEMIAEAQHFLTAS